MAFGAYVYASPYLAIYSFKSALESKDPSGASEYIDFPSVRSSLKEQIKLELGKKILGEYSDNPLAFLGMAIVNPLIDGVVNTTVTPSGLRMLFYEGELSQTDDLPEVSGKIEPTTTNSVNSDNSDQRSSFKYHYTSYNRFVTSNYFNDTDDKVAGIWRRKGLVNWQLIAIELPDGIWTD
ncbi:DUF2939 domain-containing protein [Prochlorococcus sp. MIT 0703]|uniref:DUF2939 domain-containing protein n=1 Tax=Prochlorococcus sp. MIT 0703 TaxID=1499504 RepID=UPI0019D344B3|nr:DUF2939 domain-containing protein [Prochlorococcus sp. MIT 0703]